MKNKYLCILFCLSSGQNGENLGSDEQEIVNLSYLIIDTKLFKIIDTLSYLITPRYKTTNFLTDECKILTGLDESQFENSIYLEDALNEFDKYLNHQNKQLNPNQIENNEFVFLTDGNLHLRQLLIPECSKKDIKLPNYYFTYFDLRKEFKKYARSDKVFNLDEISKRHTFEEPEYISQELEHGICSLDDSIEENTIVRVRGLPWQCTDQDVNKFFFGLNISEGGVALCLSAQGRRNGEALVRFINEEHRNLALRRHKHHIGQRYIEVYRASGKDFLNIAGGSNSEVKAFLSRNGKVILRMRGLPFDAVAKDVLEFFERGENSCSIVDGESGVLFVHYPDGRATGDAFVMLKDEEEVAKALQKHKATMGPRYIELFRSTMAEVQQVFKRSQDPKFYQSSFKDTPIAPLPILPPEMITGGNRRDCIRLRNLPLECGVEQILEFLGIHSQHIIHQGVHMIFNAQGQPSGEAFIQFDGEQSALNVTNHKNGKCMYFSGRKFFIEVIQCSGEEMNLVLIGVLPSNLLNVQVPPPTPPPSASSSLNVQVSQMTNVSASKASLNPNNLNLNPYLLVNQGSNFVQQSSSTIHQNQLNSAAVFYPSNVSNTNQLQTRSSINPSMHLPNNSLISNSIISNSIISSNQFSNPPPQFAAPIIYYLTPPVSPSSSAVFLQTPGMMHHSISPSVIILKGAPINVTITDILQFFNGYEILPECIQIQNYSDGFPNGLNTSDVLITFFNRSEAERALIEKNHQKIGNHIVELYLTI